MNQEVGESGDRDGEMRGRVNTFAVASLLLSLVMTCMTLVCFDPVLHRT